MNPQMMRKLATGLAIVSTVAAFMFAIMFIRRGSDGQGGEKPVTKPGFVVVATSPIQSGEPLSSTNGKFKLAKVDDASTISEDSLQTLESLDGMVAAGVMEPNKPVSKKAVIAMGQSERLRNRIPHGLVAYTLAVDRFTAVNGFVKPNDRVDVVATINFPDGSAEARMVLQDILILAVNSQGTLVKEEPAKDGSPTATEEPPTSVTLAVKRDQSLKLMAAETKGKLRLVLRGTGDLSTSAVPTANNSEYGPRPPKTVFIPSPARQPQSVVVTQRPAALPPMAPWQIQPYPPAPNIYRSNNAPSQPEKTPTRTITITKGTQQPEIRTVIDQ